MLKAIIIGAAIAAAGLTVAVAVKSMLDFREDFNLETIFDEEEPYYAED